MSRRLDEALGAGLRIDHAEALVCERRPEVLAHAPIVLDDENEGHQEGGRTGPLTRPAAEH